MESVYDYVRKNMMRYYEEMEERDEGVTKPLYDEGDWVRRLMEPKADGLNTKFIDKFYPIPYEVYKRISNETVILRDTESGVIDETPRNVKRIRPWTGARQMIPTPKMKTNSGRRVTDPSTHQVSEIINRRVSGVGLLEYQVRYTGYGTRSKSRQKWLQPHEILNKELIKIFERANPQTQA